MLGWLHVDSGREGCCADTDCQPAPIDGLLRRVGGVRRPRLHHRAAGRPRRRRARDARPSDSHHQGLIPGVQLRRRSSYAAAQRRWSLVRDEQRRPSDDHQECLPPAFTTSTGRHPRWRPGALRTQPRCSHR